MDDKISRSPFTRGVIAAISLCYAISAGILYSQIGLWESVRQVLVNGTIVVSWLWSASIILRHAPIPESVPIRYPKFELGWLLTGLLLAVGWAANFYGGWLPLPRWLFYLSTFGTVLILFVGLRYPMRSLGLIWPPKPAWLVFLVTILINIGAAVFFKYYRLGKRRLCHRLILLIKLRDHCLSWFW